MYFSSPASTRRALGPGSAVLSFGPAVKVFVVMMSSSSSQFPVLSVIRPKFERGVPHPNVAPFATLGWDSPGAEAKSAYLTEEERKISRCQRDWRAHARAEPKGTGADRRVPQSSRPAEAECEPSRA